MQNTFICLKNIVPTQNAYVKCRVLGDETGIKAGIFVFFHTKNHPIFIFRPKGVLSEGGEFFFGGGDFKGISSLMGPKSGSKR